MHQLVPNFILERYAANVVRGAFFAAGMFVDISGFSTLTDVLMQHGGYGAEVLAGVMRSAFSPLIEVVFEQMGISPWLPRTGRACNLLRSGPRG